MWIAIAQTDRDCNFQGPSGILKDEIRHDFIRVQERVIQAFGTCDGGLSDGHLTCVACKLHFAEALGLDFSGGLNFPNAIAWDCVFDTWLNYGEKPQTEAALWAYWSVREFLNVCRKHKLAIRFI